MYVLDMCSFLVVLDIMAGPFLKQEEDIFLSYMQERTCDQFSLPHNHIFDMFVLDKVKWCFSLVVLDVKAGPFLQKEEDNLYILIMFTALKWLPHLNDDNNDVLVWMTHQPMRVFCIKVVDLYQFS